MPGCCARFPGRARRLARGSPCRVRITDILNFRRVLSDVKRYWKWIAIAASFQAIAYAVMYAVLHGGPGSLRAEVRVSLSPVSNVVEELLFRVTGIPCLELWERRMFGEVGKSRVILVTSVSFALIHLPGLFGAPDHLRPFEAANIVFCFYIGVMLANLFYESRNAPSVVALHWWINIQSEILQLAAYTIAASIR